MGQPDTRGTSTHTPMLVFNICSPRARTVPVELSGWCMRQFFAALSPSPTSFPCGSFGKGFNSAHFQLQKRRHQLASLSVSRSTTPTCASYRSARDHNDPKLVSIRFVFIEKCWKRRQGCGAEPVLHSSALFKKKSRSTFLCFF